MIQYDNKNWFQFLFKASSLAYNFPGMLWGMVTIGLATFIVIQANIAWSHGHAEMIIPESFAHALGNIHTVLGIVVGLILVFRTNTAYDRWWEGRIQLGKISNTLRNIALKLNAYMIGSAYEQKEEMIKILPAFFWTVKEHLREEDFSAYKAYIPETLQQEFDEVKHKPNFLLKKFAIHLKNIFDKQIITGHQLTVIESQASELTYAMGACERIRHTPIPMGYALHLKRVLLIYLITLPITFLVPLKVAFFSAHLNWVPYLSIPLVMMVFYIMIGIELLGEEIEDPFGDDPNDLPVDEMCDAIHENVDEIMA